MNWKPDEGKRKFDVGRGKRLLYRQIREKKNKGLDESLNGKRSPKSKEQKGVKNRKTETEKSAQAVSKIAHRLTESFWIQTASQVPHFLICRTKVMLPFQLLRTVCYLWSSWITISDKPLKNPWGKQAYSIRVRIAQNISKCLGQCWW